MTSKSKLALIIIVMLSILGCAVLIASLGSRFSTPRLSSRVVLDVEISGELPEYVPESALSGLFGPKILSRQDLRDALLLAASDHRVRVVRIKVGGLYAGFATVQETRNLINNINKSGKRTVAYLETAGEGGSGNLPYYLASACQEIVLHPMGDVSVTGLAARRPFIRGMLDKLGIEPDFPGVGDYKTARFFYTQKDFTPADREMTTWLLESIANQMSADIAASRKLDAGHVAGLFRRGPFLAEEAVKEKLIDKVADWSELFEDTAEENGNDLQQISLRRYLREGRPNSQGAPIAVVFATGQILRGSSGYSPMPMVGGDVMGSDTLANALRQVRDSDARAVVLRINSPGGSVIASEIIRREMERTAKEIPVIVSMGDVAASGGYWIACGAKEVIADPGTITGSIGVFSGHLAMERFWEEKLGVTWGKIDMAPNADLFGSLQPWTPEQRELMNKWLNNIYGSFLSRVAASRKMTTAQVDAIGRGRVFTGVQAKENGLIDAIGDFDFALQRAKKAAGIAETASVKLEFYPKTKSIIETLLDRNDESARMKALVKALEEGRVMAPGPVWMPPLQIR